MRNAEEHTQTSLENKFPLLEIDLELTKVMPPDEVIELVNACVSLSDYARNDIRNAFFRALSIPALDVYVDTDQRCKVAIDIIVNGLENRFTEKPKLEYEWKDDAFHLRELEGVDEYGNGLFTDYWVSEPTDLGLNSERALEEPDVLEIQDALEVANTTEVDDVPAISDAQVLNAPEDVGTPEDVNAPEDADTPAILDAPEIPDAPEVNYIQVPNAPDDGLAQEDDITQVNNAPEDGGVVEVAEAPEIPNTPEVNNAPEVDGSTEVDRSTEIPELVLSSPSPAKKRTRKTSEASNNTMILAEILQELKEIKALLKDKQ